MYNSFTKPTDNRRREELQNVNMTSGIVEDPFFRQGLYHAYTQESEMVKCQFTKPMI